MLDPAKLRGKLNKSYCYSWKIFSLNMVRKIFDEKTMKRSNVAGKFGN